MLSLLRKVFNGSLIKDIIDNFDPYHINEMTRLELAKEQNKKENNNGTLGKN
jgi:hypothetical protein